MSHVGRAVRAETSTLHHVLTPCHELARDQVHQAVDIDHCTVHDTGTHIVGNVEL